jgi:1-acyl-sn-glycerol-3-phosphate acyltransferase
MREVELGTRIFNNMVYPIARKTLLPLVRFFIKKTVGLENLPLKGPYIVACKHLGPLDGTFIASVIIPRVNQKIYFIANIPNWGILWQKIVAEQWAGNIIYNPDNPSICLEAAYDYLQKGRIVGIFPEGIIQEYDPHKKRAKTGTARLALKARVPIIPIGLVHDVSVRNDLPMLQQRRQVIKNILVNPHSLEIHIGQPFTLKDYYDKEITRELLEQATNDIMDKVDGLTQINHKG